MNSKQPETIFVKTQSIRQKATARYTGDELHGLAWDRHEPTDAIAEWHQRHDIPVDGWLEYLEAGVPTDEVDPDGEPLFLWEFPAGYRFVAPEDAMLFKLMFGAAK